MSASTGRLERGAGTPVVGLVSREVGLVGLLEKTIYCLSRSLRLVEDRGPS